MEASDKTKRAKRGEGSTRSVQFRYTEKYDLPILLELHEHRILRLSHLARLTGRSIKAITGRMLALRTAGYVVWIDPKKERHHKANPEGLYAIGDRGSEKVSEQHGLSDVARRAREKNRGVDVEFVTHELLISDFLVEIKLGCRKTDGNVEYVSQDEIFRGCSERAQSHDPLLLTVKVGNKVRKIRPDFLYGLRFTQIPHPKRQGENFCDYALGEADSGDMKQKATAKTQSDNYKKFEVYDAWGRVIYDMYNRGKEADESEFFLENFRVQFITRRTQERVINLIEKVRPISEGGKNQWIFTSWTRLLSADQPLSAKWMTGKGEYVSLMR